jgi:AcrR family transcriptional regulator
MSTTPASGPPPAPRRGRPPSGGRDAVLAAALELLREVGASRLTTREVASRAGVSEGSVFYHFTDRTGLLTAVIEDGLSTLGPLGAGRLEGDSLAEVLDTFTAAVEGFLDRSLVVMIAAQSDAELRTALTGYLAARDMGPHRGILALAGYLEQQQRAGAIRSDVDPRAVAHFVYSTCFERSGVRRMVSESYGANLLPGREDLVATMATLLAPPATTAPIPD